MTALSTWTATWKLIRLHPGAFAQFSLLYLFALTSRLLPGLIVQAFFDHLTMNLRAGRSTTWTKTVPALVFSVIIFSPFCSIM